MLLLENRKQCGSNEEPGEDYRGITSDLMVVLIRVKSILRLCEMDVSLDAVREQERSEGFRDFNLRTYMQAPANALNKRLRGRAKRRWEQRRKGRSSNAALRATDCSRIRRETCRVTRCVGAEFVIRTYARTYDTPSRYFTR